jgi:predicted DNA-binding transcriptional regulator AlpA
VTFADVVRQLEAAPPGSLVPRDWLLAQLRDADDVPAAMAPDPATAAPATWREKLWTVPGETRLGVRELAEALDRPRSWIYRHTSPKSGLELLPHRKLDGELTFPAGEIRTWLKQHEDVIEKPVTAIVPITRGARANPKAAR